MNYKVKTGVAIEATEMGIARPLDWIYVRAKKPPISRRTSPNWQLKVVEAESAETCLQQETCHKVCALCHWGGLLWLVFVYYIGQTGRCWNDRLREHAASLRNNYGSHLPGHCKTCGCSPLLDGAQVEGRNKGRLERELLEATKIHACDKDVCISVASVYMQPKEYSFINTI